MCIFLVCHRHFGFFGLQLCVVLRLLLRFLIFLQVTLWLLLWLRVLQILLIILKITEIIHKFLRILYQILSNIQLFVCFLFKTVMFYEKILKNLLLFWRHFYRAKFYIFTEFMHLHPILEEFEKNGLAKNFFKLKRRVSKNESNFMRTLCPFMWFG